MRVLLADDQALLRSAIRLLLEEEEASIEVVGEVSEASCLESAVNTLRPDLLLLDWELPGLRTIHERQQLISRLHRFYGQLYIIALIGSPELDGNPLESGADAFVSKANPPEYFLKVVHQAIQALEPSANVSGRDKQLPTR